MESGKLKQEPQDGTSLFLLRRGCRVPRQAVLAASRRLAQVAGHAEDARSSRIQPAFNPADSTLVIARASECHVAATHHRMSDIPRHAFLLARCLAAGLAFWAVPGTRMTSTSSRAGWSA